MHSKASGELQSMAAKATKSTSSHVPFPGEREQKRCADREDGKNFSAGAIFPYGGTEGQFNSQAAGKQSAELNIQQEPYRYCCFDSMQSQNKLCEGRHARRRTLLNTDSPNSGVIRNKNKGR